ncbi:MAG: hypothetical protein OXE40_05750 [Gammaproteobacteria bacterium]|nr:hypothetical protein [Gammaproteobacteria bacterium]
MTEPAPDWWARAIADFGAGMGFPDAGGWNSRVLNLSVDGGAYLIDVERSGEQIVLAVLRRAPLSELEEKALALLRATGVEQYHPFLLQFGLKGDNVLVLAARIERSEAFRMVEAFELIRRLFADVGL